MRNRRIFPIAVATAILVLTSGLALAGGGCLAGRYQYFNDQGALVGAETVGCANSSSWGVQTSNRQFVAGCGTEF